jgi:hypothetical protein
MLQWFRVRLLPGLLSIDQCTYGTNATTVAAAAAVSAVIAITVS